MTWTAWGHTYIKKARDQHLCAWCNEYIDKGSAYFRYREKEGDDDPFTQRLHIECDDVRRLGGDWDAYAQRRGCACLRDGDPCDACVDKGVTE